MAKARKAAPGAVARLQEKVRKLQADKRRLTRDMGALAEMVEDLREANEDLKQRIGQAARACEKRLTAQRDLYALEIKRIFIEAQARGQKRWFRLRRRQP